MNGKWHPIGCTVGNVYLIRKAQKWNYLYIEALAASVISQRSKQLAKPILQLKVRNVNIKSPQMSPTPFRLSTYHNTNSFQGEIQQMIQNRYEMRTLWLIFLELREFKPALE